jgi:hypothetical protein
MAQPLTGTEILNDLKMLADWIRVKYLGERFELIVVGGAAMAIEGFKDQTKDIDVIRPEVLPEPIQNGATHIARIRRRSPRWINCDVSNMLLQTKGWKALPEYFNEISRSIQVAENLKIGVISRQALISLKLYAATPSYSKHTVDIKRLHPNVAEITEAVCFVLSFDDTEVRKDDLRFILKDLGFDLNDIYRKIERGDEQGC